MLSLADLYGSNEGKGRREVNTDFDIHKNILSSKTSLKKYDKYNKK